MAQSTNGADVRPATATDFADIDHITQLRENWSRVPNQLFDLMGDGKLSHAELCVLLYLIRVLWGWSENVRHLSLDELASGRRRKDGSQIDKGSGVSRASVKRAVKSLEQRGFIVVWRGEKENGGTAANCYALRIRGEN